MVRMWLILVQCTHLCTGRPPKLDKESSSEELEHDIGVAKGDSSLSEEEDELSDDEDDTPLTAKQYRYEVSLVSCITCCLILVLAGQDYQAVHNSSPDHR